jgi:hypothetical protein
MCWVQASFWSMANSKATPLDAAHFFCNPKSTFPFDSAPGELTHWHKIIEFYMIALADGTNKMNLAILIREHLKVCFEQKCFQKKCLCFWRVALSSWKGVNLIMSSWIANWATVSPSSCSLPEHCHGDLCKCRDHPGETGFPTLQCVQSSVPTGHLNYALACDAFQQRHRLETGRTDLRASRRDEGSVLFSCKIKNYSYWLRKSLWERVRTGPIVPFVFPTC